MMLKPLNPFLLVAMAAAPMTSAQAAPVLASTFKCDVNPKLGGTLQWADGAQATPLVGYSDSLDFSKSVFSPLACADGQFAEKRKSGEGQKDFLKITFAEASAKPKPRPRPRPCPPGHCHIKFSEAQVLSTSQPLYRSMWEVTLDFDQDADGTNFFGFELVSPSKSVDEDLQLFISDKEEYSFSAPNREGTFRLFAAPQAPDDSQVPEPGTLVLLGTGLLGMAAAKRRRRGW